LKVDTFNMNFIFHKLKDKIFEKIRFKLSLFIFVLVVFTTFVFYIFTVQMMNRYILDELIKRAESVSSSVEASATHSLLLGDLLGIDNIIYKLKALHRDVEYIAVVDTDMKVIAHTDIEQRGETLQPAKGRMLKEGKNGMVVNEISRRPDNYYEVVTPFTFKDKQLGTILLGINKSVLVDAKKKARNRILAGFAATLLLGIIGIFMVSHFITRPIKELSSGVDKLKDGKRGWALRVYSKDELGKLTENFNTMAKLITSQKENLNKYAQDLEEAYVSTVRVLAAAIDARDPYTHGHSTRVAKVSLKVGEAIGLSRDELEDLEIACLFHDVGKLKTPDLILKKMEQLDSVEYNEMMRHTEDGAEILSKAHSLKKYMPAVRHHHEWYNGNGYPDGLKGDQIPLFAAIISIADAFDSMTSTRPYRKALSEEEALAELAHLSGTQFNPRLVKVFIQVMNEQKQTAGQPYETK
jgi:putative nucleotidyltransferase with HDIG domain